MTAILWIAGFFVVLAAVLWAWGWNVKLPLTNHPIRTAPAPACFPGGYGRANRITFGDISYVSQGSSIWYLEQGMERCDYTDNRWLREIWHRYEMAETVKRSGVNGSPAGLD